MKNSTVLGRAVSAGKFKLSGQGNYSCVAVNNYGNYTRIDFSVVFIGKYCLVCDVVSFFYRIPLNHRTYIQSHPHRGTRGTGGGGSIEPPLGFWYVALFWNNFAFGGKPLIFSTRWGIFYGWWPRWRPLTSPNMVAILTAVLDFIKN